MGKRRRIVACLVWEEESGSFVLNSGHTGTDPDGIISPGKIKMSFFKQLVRHKLV